MKFSISIFLHFRTQQVFPRCLAKFQVITKITKSDFISENLAPPNIARISETKTLAPVFVQFSTLIVIIISIRTVFF